MAYVSSDQIERARQIPALDYILRYESGNIKRVGTEYRLRDHKSLAVGNKGWYWHSKGIGSKTALDFLTDVRGYGLVDAVCFLLNEQPQGLEYICRPIKKSQLTSSEKTKSERASFSIPRHNINNNRVIAYLQSRGIDKGLILDCINRGDLYESAYRHDCIFKGRDETGIVKYAAIRSTTSAFKGDAEGSDKRYSFILPPTDLNSNTVMVCESPLDILSHQTMCIRGYIQPFDEWRLSLGGTSILGLEHFLKYNPQVNHCIVCTDNDEAGDITAAKIMDISKITAERLLPSFGTDWNETLLALQKAERVQNRVQSITRQERG
jgi:hypothetical protein